MEKINGIILEGKVYVAAKDDKQSCLKCDLIEDDGKCAHHRFCIRLGADNIFRYSPELTDKINHKQ